MQTYPSHSAGPSAPPSLVSALHRHALESILGFFTLEDLPELMRVCHAFRSAIGSMAPLLDWASVDSSSSIASICNSPLIMHVGHLRLRVISPQSLALLASKAVHLQSLQWIPTDLGDDDRWVLPPKLTSLDLSLRDASSQVINSALVAVGALSFLGELEVALPSLARVDLAPLSRLESLRTLIIRIQPVSEDADDPAISAEFTPEQRDVIRGLSHSLTALHVDPRLTEASVRELFAAGHSFRLKDLGDSVTSLPLTAEFGELLGSLPLDRLILLPADAFHLSPQLAPTLRSLHVHLDHCTVKPDAIVAVVSRLTGLTSLTLTDSDLTTAHLATLVLSLPQLRELTLIDMRELQSLAFLAEAGAPKLACLSLHYCTHEKFSPLELQHLRRSQPQLMMLSLGNAFNAPLDAFCRSLLEPPSIVFPLLDEFDYKFDVSDQNAVVAEAGEQHAEQHDDGDEEQ